MYDEINPRYVQKQKAILIGYQTILEECLDKGVVMRDGKINKGGKGMDWAFPHYLSKLTILLFEDGSYDGSYEIICIVEMGIRVFL
jgi:hypothetical protein